MSVMLIRRRPRDALLSDRAYERFETASHLLLGQVRLGAKPDEDAFAVGVGDGGLPDGRFDRRPANPEVLGDLALRASSGTEGRKNTLAEIHGQKSRHGSE